MNKQHIIKMVDYNKSFTTSKAGPAPLKKKKPKKIIPVSKICAEAKVEQFPDYFHAEGHFGGWHNERSHQIKNLAKKPSKKSS